MMATLFDIDVSSAANTLSMDKRKYNGSTLPSYPMTADKDELIVSQFKETCSRTPTKILLEPELSKEAKSKSAPSSLVARLMGLDSLPKRQVSTFSKRKEDHASAMIGLEECLPSRRHEPHLFENMPCEVEPYTEEFVSDPCHPKNNEQDAMFTGQKYIDPRHLSANENEDSSDEYDRILENIKYNKDLFLKFFQQPNSLCAQHLREMSTRLPSGTKHITVLKPSSTGDNNRFPRKMAEKWVTKPAQISQANGLNRTNNECSAIPSNWKADDEPQPTWIVVLKPFLAKEIHTGNEYTSPSLTPRTLHDENCFRGRLQHEAQQSRDMAKEVTKIIRESLGSIHMDEPSLSSALSSGYIGDESSPEKSEIKYAPGSDCEPISSASQYSWDNMDQFASCSSSISHVPCARESSVFREAKKRLSKRWNAMGLNEKSQGIRHARSHSSHTLGEMLALSEIRRPIRSTKSNEEIMESVLSLNKDSKKDETALCSPKNIIRSNSVPLSAAGNCEWVSDEVSHPKVVKSSDEKELQKINTVKQLVANLFSARNRNSDKEYSPLELGLSVEKPVTAGNVMESQDQPSPNSVLEPLFGDDDSRSADSSGILSSEPPVTTKSFYKTSSPVVGKSPPIESVSRTLCWNDSYANTSSSGCPFDPSLICSEPDEEQDWNISVQVLLSTLGPINYIPPDACMDWCDAPQMSLDPSLREKYANAAIYFMHGAKLRSWRSNRKLIFDSVNQALNYISQLDLLPNIDTSTEHYDIALPTLVDHVWAILSQWVADSVRCVPTTDDGDEMKGKLLVVERVVRKEVAGKRWLDTGTGFMKTDTIGIRLQQKLLDELLDETVVILLAATRQATR